MTAALVQTTGPVAITGSGAQTLTLTLPAPTGTGNCLIASFHMLGDTASPTAVALTSGSSSSQTADNWANAIESLGTANSDVGKWVDPNATAGQTTVKIAGTGSTGVQTIIGVVEEWSGLATTFAALVGVTCTPLRQSANSASWSVSTSAAAAVGDLISACAGSWNLGGTTTSFAQGTPGAPWIEETDGQQTSTGYYQRFAVGYQVATSASVFTYSGTAGSGCRTSAVVVALHAAAVASYANESTVTGSGTSAACALPTGTVSGDLLIAALNTGSGSTGFTPPSGWAQVIAPWTDSNDTAGCTWYKVAGGSEPSSYTFTWTTSSDYCCSIKRITQANTSTPIRTGARHDKASATGAGFTSTALSGTQPTDLTMVIAQMGDDSGSTTYTVTNPVSPPWTTIDNFKPSGSPKFQGASWANGSRAGATFTSSSATAYWNITSFAIETASGAVTDPSAATLTAPTPSFTATAHDTENVAATLTASTASLSATASDTTKGAVATLSAPAASLAATSTVNRFVAASLSGITPSLSVSGIASTNWSVAATLSATVPSFGATATKFHPLPRLALAVRSRVTGRWKYIAQRALTKQWLDRTGIPLTSDTLTWDLKTNSLQGTINPQYFGLVGPDGLPVIDPWSTFIYAELDGAIQWGGIVTSSDFSGPQWNLQATGFRGYPSGQVYNGASYSQIDIDPLAVIRFLWAYLQSQPNADLGLQLANTSSPVRIGSVLQATDVTPANFPASGKAVKNTTTFAVAISITGGTVTKVLINGVDTGRRTGAFTLQPNNTITVSYSNQPNWTWTAQEPIPYQLDWWNGTDIGQELTNLSTVTPFDMSETHSWNSDMTDVVHQLNLGYPRLGTRQSGLRFVEGENITVLPTLNQDGTQYQNAVIGYGAGSGSTQTHWNSGLVDTSRLYRSYAYTNAAESSAEKLAPLARADLMARIGMSVVQSIQVTDHPHAPFGSFAAGDDILVQLTSGWMRGQAIWHRITSYNYSTLTNQLVLTLARSDSFSYAQGDLTTA